MKVNKFVLFVAGLLCSSTTLAEEYQWEDTWNYAKIVEKDEDGNYLSYSGRLHMDSVWFDGNQGNHEEVSFRRLRFGFKGKYGDFTSTFEGDFNLNNELGDFYNRITDAKIDWRFSDSAKLTLLKQGVGFTMDGNTSSKRLLTPQRNNLSNNLWFTAEYFTGIALKGSTSNNWDYKTGIYSTDGSDEIGVTEASYFANASVTKSFGKTEMFDKSQVTFDYIYNDEHEDANTRDFSNIASLYSKMSKGKFDLAGEVAYGKGYFEQSDLWGVVIMPSYRQTEKTAWVLRYTHIDSNGANGIRLGRYDNDISSERGDKYDELYAGVNWYYNKDKFKLQLGMQYTKMDDEDSVVGDYDAIGISLALRAYW